ncbi:hypothetical protein [Alphaproteobacteria bacterium endosymbiont of Tiliacea citrago]|uniref:hypothetical protein n=1 Tax=Alphaproteobacteria bacterium endosymbiont of Tiliacea citrago TaxID=3077944 RepID=UPI00313B46C4
MIQKRPICLLGGVESAKIWITNFVKNEDLFILPTDALIEDIHFFQKFINESSLNNKVGVIYFFNNLSESKQSVFLKIFEDLPCFSKIIIHISNFTNFTIHTRCDLHYLNEDKNFSNDLSSLFSFFYKKLNEGSLNQNTKNGIKVYLETLNLYNNGFLTEDEKNFILKDLK